MCFLYCYNVLATNTTRPETRRRIIWVCRHALQTALLGLIYINNFNIFHLASDALLHPWERVKLNLERRSSCCRGQRSLFSFNCINYSAI